MELMVLIMTVSTEQWVPANLEVFTLPASYATSDERIDGPTRATRSGPSELPTDRLPLEAPLTPRVLCLKRYVVHVLFEDSISQGFDLDIDVT